MFLQNMSINKITDSQVIFVIIVPLRESKYILEKFMAAEFTKPALALLSRQGLDLSKVRVHMIKRRLLTTQTSMNYN